MTGLHLMNVLYLCVGFTGRKLLPVLFSLHYVPI